MSARPRILLRPSESFTTGSWKRTTPTASSAKTMPTSFSLIRLTFFANAGRSSTASEIAAVMNAALRSVKRVKTRSASTARQLPPSRSSCRCGARTRVRTSM